MTVPLSNRPKITQEDLFNGFVTRYFVRSISTNAITEIDSVQFGKFKSNPLYQTLELPWLIVGRAYDSTSVDGKIVYGTQHKNIVTTIFYDKRMPGLARILREPLKYFNGVYNIPEKLPIQNTPIPRFETTVPIITTTTSTETPTISVIPTNLLFTYTIGGTTPPSQSLSVTATAVVSGLSVVTGSSWISASLSSTTTPATINITPIITGLYSGSYTSSVTVSGTGVESVSSSVTLTVGYSSSVLFAYEPGMSLSPATFTRATSASYNELVS